MTVSVETLAIGNADGPRVYLVVRRVGRHADMEECGADVTDLMGALAYAARRWRVRGKDVRVAPVQVVEIEAADKSTVS